MNRYRVTFRVDVDAEHFNDAAARALELLHDRGTDRTCRVLEWKPEGAEVTVLLPAAPMLVGGDVANVLAQSFEVRGLEAIAARSTDPVVRYEARARADAIRAVDENGGAA